MHSAYLLWQRGQVAGWLSDTRRYCINTAKYRYTYLKTCFDLLVAPSFYFLLTPSRYPIPRDPVQRGVITAYTVNNQSHIVLGDFNLPYIPWNSCYSQNDCINKLVFDFAITNVIVSWLTFRRVVPTCLTSY